MRIGLAREIAARIWCDPEMSHIVMDTQLAEEIAILLCTRVPTQTKKLPTRLAPVSPESGETAGDDTHNTAQHAEGEPCPDCGRTDGGHFTSLHPFPGKVE